MSFAQFSLRFSADLPATDLENLFGLLPAWEPALTPTTIVRRGPGWPPAQMPLRAEDLAELVRGCVARRQLEWTFGTRSGLASWSVRTWRDQVFVDACLPFGGAVEPRLVALLEKIEPGVAFVIDRVADEPLRCDGLDGITAMPPLLFLDGVAVARIGEARARSAPCRVRDLGTGVLLVVCDDLDASITPERYARRAEVLKHLGLFAGASLR